MAIRPIRAACLAIAVTASGPAKADFFDDARRTVTRDIPHFFQDDIPCTFGDARPAAHAAPAHRTSPRPARLPHRALLARTNPQPGADICHP